VLVASLSLGEAVPALGAYMVVATQGRIAAAIRWFTHSKVNHAAVYVDAGMIVEAQPGGACLTPALHYGTAIWSVPKFTPQVGYAIANCARDLVGTPYNFLDIAAQAVVRLFHWHAPDWALRRLSTSKRLQCAQLVDEAYRRAGVQLFKDARPEGLVAPSDLYDLMEK
jgi:hypothetical protein